MISIARQSGVRSPMVAQSHPIRDKKTCLFNKITRYGIMSPFRLVWLLTGGREHAFREKILYFARLQPGESVLDVGCGTGSLAIRAKQQVGPTGEVTGLDASPEMLARAHTGD